MKAIGYIRVSSEEQAREGISLDMQAVKIRDYCALHDIELVAVIEEDRSAKDMKGRPKFQAALDEVLNNGTSALVVWRLDRGFRNTREALAVSQALDQKGKALVSVSENLDTKTALGRFFFTLVASLAEMERGIIGERTSAAMQRKKERGEKHCRCAPYGFKWNEDKKLEPDEYEQSVITRARVLAQNLSVARICNRLIDEGYKPRGQWFSWGLIQRIIG